MRKRSIGRRMHVGARLPITMVAELDRITGRRGLRNRSHVIEMACQDFLDSLEAKRRKSRKRKSVTSDEDSE